MPDHCLPRNYDPERQVPWGGGPIMRDSDKPLSFFVRGTMLRRSPDASGPEGETISDAEPRGLPPPRLKSPPPPRPYFLKMKEIPEIDPSEIVTYDGMQYWLKDGVPKSVPSAAGELRIPGPKAPTRPLQNPVPGLLKRSRGRRAPAQDSIAGAMRKHPCPVEGCGKVFKKRTHLRRHVESLHTHEKTWSCMMPFCDKSFTRQDNFLRHQKQHSVGYQEILACSAEDHYKGVLVENPLVRNPDSFHIKPFANIAIHPTALGLWRHEQRMRERGMTFGSMSDCDRYFHAHPEEREAALRGDPEWEWRMPPAGEEFKHMEHNCLEGVFKVDIKRPSRDPQ